MNSGKTIFSQLMDFLPRYEFRLCVQRYNGNYKVKSFSCWDQFLSMAFAQLTGRESLRAIEACLRATPSRLYHAGIRGNVSRNTLAHANQVRHWRIYADFAPILITKARLLYANDPFGVELEQSVYALDSTTIDLCLAVFPWAQFRQRKAAVKLHTLLDLRGCIPSVVIVTTGKVHDVRVLDQLPIEPGAIYIVDRGYIDFTRLHGIHLTGSFFVTRAKNNFRFQRLYSQPITSPAVRCNQIVVPRNFYARRNYSSKLRRIRYVDPETQKRLTFLTNNFTLTAEIVAALYRCRWQVELFFKWIKQHLRIKAFYGTKENAVKTQVWIAITVYVLVAIVKKMLKLDHSLYNILQILSIAVFEKTPIDQALARPPCTDPNYSTPNQLQLCD